MAPFAPASFREADEIRELKRRVKDILSASIES